MLNENKKLNICEVDSIIEGFIRSNIPIVCLAGIKRLVVPLILTRDDIEEGIKFKVLENKTILYKVDEELIN